MTALTDSRLYWRIAEAKHGVIILSGTGQHGKTVTMHALLNACFPDRNKAMVNYPAHFVDEYLPDDYRAVEWPEDLQDFPDLFHASRDVVVIDDAAFFAGARDHASRSNKAIQKVLTIASHHELFFILTIQNMGLLDLALLQSQDVYMIHKKMDLLGLQIERPQIQLKQVIANMRIDSAIREYPDMHPKGWSYVSSPTYELLYNRLPEYWTPELSKPFKGVIPS